jgi:truncated hemoglobin YjbI
LHFFSLCYTQDDSICDKYSQALNLTNAQLVKTVVDGVVKKITSVGTVTKKYFDGTKPKGSTNFLDAKNAGALSDLVASLVQFFGAGLGCSDGTITPYTGPSMSKVHQPMGINSAEFGSFNEAVISVLANAGVSDIDQVAVRIVLESFKKDVVVQGSICDRYSQALKITNKELVQSVVVKAFTAITADSSPIKKYFDGRKPPGSLNYLNPKNKVSLDGLVNGLTTWFGDALGCSDDTIPPYGGPPLAAVHKRMGINEDEFNFFNGGVVSILRASGVVSKDLVAVARALNGTKADIVTA